MKDITRCFSLVSPTVGLLIFLAVKGVIGFGDIVLNTLFVCIAFAAFGVRWRHRLWGRQQTDAHERVRRMLSKVYLTATILTVVVPLISVGTAYVLRVHAPQYIDEAIVGTMGQRPAVIHIDTLNVSIPESNGAQSYIAVFQNNSENISPTRPVMKVVLGQVDGGVRVPAAWIGAVTAIVLMIALAVGEMFADMNMARPSRAPTAPCVAPPSPTPQP